MPIDYKPFVPHTVMFTVDFSVPAYKIAAEWDGPFHWRPIHGEDHLKKIQRMDNAKNFILKKHGWKLIRVVDDLHSGRNYRRDLNLKIRTLIREIESAINVAKHSDTVLQEA